MENKKKVWIKINRSLIYFIIISSMLLFYFTLIIASDERFIGLESFSVLYTSKLLILGMGALCEDKVIMIVMLVLYLLMELAMILILIPVKRIYKVRVISSYIIRMFCVVDIWEFVNGSFTDDGSLYSMFMSIILFFCLSYEFKSKKDKKNSNNITLNYDDISKVTR